MDLRSQLEERRKNLKATRTLVTNELGERFEVVDGVARKLSEMRSPFVIDEKPDLQVASIVEGLFLSSQDPATSDELLKLNRIGHVLSLGIQPSLKFQGIRYHFVDFLDLPEFDISTGLQKCIDIIDSSRGDNILVHCNAGISRSATVVIAYLMASEQLTYDEAYARVKTIRPCIRPNDGFVRQLKDLSNINVKLSAVASPTDISNKNSTFPKCTNIYNNYLLPPPSTALD